MAYSRRDLLAISFFLGFSSAVAQVLLVRELLTIFRGNEFIIGIIYSSWFLGIFLGARLNPAADPPVLARRVTLSLLLLPVLFAISVYLAHFLQVIIPRTIGTFFPISAEFLLSMVFTVPVSFFIGYFFPPLVSLISRDFGEHSGGTIYYVESLGAFFGGIVFSFLFIRYLNPLGVISLLLALSLFLLLKNKKKAYLLLMLLPMMLLLFSKGIESRMFGIIWNKTHAGTLVRYERTKYQTVFMETSGETVSVYGDGILIYTIPDRYESRLLYHLVQSLREGRRKMLLFGTGPGSLPHNLMSSDTVRIDYCEQDPQLWEMIEPYRERVYGPWDNGGRFAIVKMDLKHYLAHTNEKYDMIVSLPPAPENIMLNRFFTGDFYRQCRDRLTEDGIIIAAVHGFSNYMSRDMRSYIASIFKAFTDVFPHHLTTSGETIYMIGAGKEGVLPENGEVLIERYARAYGSHSHEGLEPEIVEHFAPQELRMLFEKTQLEYFSLIMRKTMPGVDPNQELKPGGYWKNIILSSLMEKSSLYSVLRNFVAIPIMAALLSLLVLWDVRRKYGQGHAVRGALMYVIGFTSISAMLVMVILYQNFEGIVYHRISLINALFMLGLTAGGFVFNRKRIMSREMVFVLLAMSLGCIAIYIRFQYDFLFWLILFVFSFLCGALFPILFIEAAGNQYIATASILDSMDHFGAIIGSVLTVMVLLPALGVDGTVYFIVTCVIISIAIASAGKFLRRLR